MKSFVTTVSIVMILFVRSLGEPVRKVPFKCDANVISCACGEKRENVTVPIKMCPSKSIEIEKNVCKPCDAAFVGVDPCLKFKLCETCQNGVPHCTSCPEGKKKSKFCNIVPVYMRRQTSDFIHVRIPRGASSEKLRTVRDIGSCVLPDRAQTHQMECEIGKNYTTCIQTCVYGLKFPEGKARSVHCEHDEGTWKPGIQECEPHMNCDLVMRAGGEITCSSHLLHNPTKCSIKCLKDHVEYTQPKTYECKGDEHWDPKLPYCVKVKPRTTAVTSSYESTEIDETEALDLASD